VCSQCRCKGVKEGLCVAVDDGQPECTVHDGLTHSNLLPSCLLCAYLQCLSQSLLPHPQLQLTTTTTAERSVSGAFSRFHASFMHKKKIETPSLRESSGTDFFYILSVPSLYPLFTQALLSGPRNLAHSEKHSRKAFSPPDQGDFLIHRFFLCLCVCVCVCVRELLLSSALHGKIQQLPEIRPNVFISLH